MFSRATPSTLLLGAAVSLTTVVSANAESEHKWCSSENAGCSAIELALPGKVFYQWDAVYHQEKNAMWSNTQILTPACVFRPESAADVAAGIKAVVRTASEFAVRGGAHMAIPV